MLLVLRVLLTLAVASPAAADVTDRLTRAIVIAPGTPITLQVTVGHVRVTGWDRPDVSLEVVRRAPDAAQLARLPLEIDTRPDGVLIRAVQQDNGRDAELQSDVVLRVPAAARLADIGVFEGGVELSDLTGACSARVERGDITATGLSGAIRLETGMGDIHLERATLLSDGVVRLRTFNGDVTLGLAAQPANARILALSMGGTIVSDIALNRRERWGPRWGEATLGNGEPVISIDVVNGNIAIRVPQ